MSDSELVRRVLAGDLDAFSALVGRYRDAYTRFAVRMLGDRDAADDVLQSAWMRAYRNLAKCRDPERFGAWLYQIVVNETRTYATRSGRRDKRFDSGAELERVAVYDRPDGEWREEIQRALDQLPTDQREAFVLKHIEELNYDEMAEVTGVGVSALKMRVKRACDRLRELLEGVHHDAHE